MHLDKAEVQTAMKFLTFHGKSAVEIHGEMKWDFKDGCSTYSIWKLYVSGFQIGHFDITDKSILEQKTLATTENKADTVHVMIFE